MAYINQKTDAPIRYAAKVSSLFEDSSAANQYLTGIAKRIGKLRGQPDHFQICKLKDTVRIAARYQKEDQILALQILYDTLMRRNTQRRQIIPNLSGVYEKIQEHEYPSLGDLTGIVERVLVKTTPKYMGSNDERMQQRDRDLAYSRILGKDWHGGKQLTQNLG